MAGSIEKRGDSYRLVKCVGYNLKGKPIKKTKTVHCKSMKEAKIELAKFVADCEKGLYIEGKSLKFEDFVEISNIIKTRSIAAFCYAFFLRKKNAGLIDTVIC